MTVRSLTERYEPVVRAVLDEVAREDLDVTFAVYPCAIDVVREEDGEQEETEVMAIGVSLHIVDGPILMSSAVRIIMSIANEEMVREDTRSLWESMVFHRQMHDLDDGSFEEILSDDEGRDT